jgi:hypothetical protein
MKYMIVKLYDMRHLDDVMLALTAHDVRHAVVLDGKAVAPALMQDVPLFAGFRVGLDEPRGAMKIIFAIVEDNETARAIRDDLKEAGVDLSDPTVARVFLLPIEELP